MIDNHWAKVGLNDHEAKQAWFTAHNQSSGQAFSGIETKYYTARQRLVRVALVLAASAMVIGYLAWAVQQNMSHLS